MGSCIVFLVLRSSSARVKVILPSILSLFKSLFFLFFFFFLFRFFFFFFAFSLSITRFPGLQVPDSFVFPLFGSAFLLLGSAFWRSGVSEFFFFFFLYRHLKTCYLSVAG